MGLPCWEKPFPLSHCHQPSPQLSTAGTALQVHALHPGSSGLRVGVIALLKSRNLFLIFIFYLGKKKTTKQQQQQKSPWGICYRLDCRAGSTQACCWSLQQHRRVSVMLKAQVAQSMEIIINKKDWLWFPQTLCLFLPRLRPRSFPFLLFLSFLPPIRVTPFGSPSLRKCHTSHVGVSPPWGFVPQTRV